ncbi:MAG: HAD-IC family P-type ATPase, partial [Cytophagales bacterium]|nr:HAD-IC family P-type ATPase [Cytophagales bacterium]
LIVECNELFANEASLTGETYPIQKNIGECPAETPLAKRSNCLWEGSNIVSGTAKAIAYYTGNETIFGELQKNLTVETETAFEKGIRDFGYFLMKITLVLSVSILVVNLIFHRPWMDSILFSLALSIGMAPELLPAIMTIAMSAGATRMMKKKVVVKKLSSIQNLGEVNLLCTDKTGTITEGEIKVAGIVDISGQPSPWVRKLAHLNAYFEGGYANPIDKALQLLETSPGAFRKISEVPYDFNRKRLSIAVSDDKESILITKGAYKNILSICTQIQLATGDLQPIGNYLETLENQFNAYSSEGFRVIAVCFKTYIGNTLAKDDEKDMVFAGFVQLEDPLKEGILDVFTTIRNLGLSIKIITGDNKQIATHIAGKLGLANHVLTGSEIEKMPEESLEAQVKETDFFAEVEPHQKEMIIHALQKSGFTVAYMGDGINDASALNAADAGISVLNATDVAREAADFVLLEKDLSVLVEGIKEGRKTFANTMKYIFINTGATFGNMFSVAGASLILPFLPMLPKQILLTNFLTDFPYMTVSSDNVDEERLLKPARWDLGLIQKFMVIFGIHSSLFDIITFLTFYFWFKAGETKFQTGWFLESILTELAILFIIRTHKHLLASQPGKMLTIISLICMTATLVLPYMPFASELGLSRLSVIELGTIAFILICYIVSAEML